MFLEWIRYFCQCHVVESLWHAMETFKLTVDLPTITFNRWINASTETFFFYGIKIIILILFYFILFFLRSHPREKSYMGRSHDGPIHVAVGPSN